MAQRRRGPSVVLTWLPPFLSYTHPLRSEYRELVDASAAYLVRQLQAGVETRVCAGLPVRLDVGPRLRDRELSARGNRVLEVTRQQLETE